MKTQYILVSEVIVIEGEKHLAFGIASSLSGMKVTNLSIDKDSVERLIDKCNDLSVSEIHIRDICEDFLISNY